MSASCEQEFITVVHRRPTKRDKRPVRTVNQGSLLVRHVLLASAAKHFHQPLLRDAPQLYYALQLDVEHALSEPLFANNRNNYGALVHAVRDAENRFSSLPDNVTEHLLLMRYLRLPGLRGIATYRTRVSECIRGLDASAVGARGDSYWSGAALCATGHGKDVVLTCMRTNVHDSCRVYEYDYSGKLLGMVALHKRISAAYSVAKFPGGSVAVSSASTNTKHGGIYITPEPRNGNTLGARHITVHDAAHPGAILFNKQRGVVMVGDFDSGMVFEMPLEGVHRHLVHFENSMNVVAMALERSTGCMAVLFHQSPDVDWFGAGPTRCLDLVCVFDAEMHLLSRWRVPASRGNSFVPGLWGIAFDFSGNIVMLGYTVDRYRLMVFEQDGALMHSIRLDAGTHSYSMCADDVGHVWLMKAHAGNDDVSFVEIV
jgi:hypothetical protein